jgi:hypothetical protein
MKRLSRRLGVGVALVGVVSLLATGFATADPTTTHSTGTLPDGATWIADVPSNWNGTLLLYSHGYGPLLAADAPDPVTQAALLGMGYAMAGSSYDPNGSWWALGSAVRDQFQTLGIVEHTELPSKPQEVYAFGTSMGGLISALEDQSSNGRLDGALTTCGIVAGGNQLNQYQLDGEYAISQLLAPSEHIQLTNFDVGPLQGSTDSLAAANELLAAMGPAQGTAQGRARLALAFAFLNVSPWGDPAQPGIYDFGAWEQGQYDDYTEGLFGGPVNAIQFIVEGREQIEAAAGGEGSGTVGVDFAKLLHQSSYYPEVRALYEDAGLSLKSDLADLDRHETLRADPRAYRWLSQTSVPSGRLQVPELDLKTISDQLVPVQQERYYHQLVARAGDAALLRQAYVQAQGHCNFTPAELVAGVEALANRVTTGSWGDVATSGQLNAAAGALDPSLGGGAFIPFWPDKLTGAVSPFAGWGSPAPSHGRHHRGARRHHRAVRRHRSHHPRR